QGTALRLLQRQGASRMDAHDRCSRRNEDRGEGDECRGAGSVIAATMTSTAVPRTRAPLTFRLATLLVRHRVRGGHRLIEFAHRRGWLNCVVQYKLGPDVSLQVPLFRPENRWSADDVRGYEHALVRGLVARLQCRPSPLRLIDCGADIGIMPALIASQLP